jgi:hypothetical protein
VKGKAGKVLEETAEDHQHSQYLIKRCWAKTSNAKPQGFLESIIRRCEG